MLVSATTLRAQGVRLSLMGSGSYLFSERLFTVEDERFRSNYAPGGKAIFSLEYTPASVLGLEASYAYGRNNLRVADLEETPPEEIGYGVRLQRYSGNLVIHSPVALGGLRPYATAGLEYLRFGPTSDAKARAFTEGFAGRQAVLESSNKLGFNVGGGVEWSLIPALALRLDVRDHSTGTPRYGLPVQSETAAIFPITGRAHNLEISAGITLHFGE